MDLSQRQQQRRQCNACPRVVLICIVQAEVVQQITDVRTRGGHARCPHHMLARKRSKVHAVMNLIHPAPSPTYEQTGAAKHTDAGELREHTGCSDLEIKLDSHLRQHILNQQARKRCRLFELQASVCEKGLPEALEPFEHAVQAPHGRPPVRRIFGVAYYGVRRLTRAAYKPAFLDCQMLQQQRADVRV